MQRKIAAVLAVAGLVWAAPAGAAPEPAVTVSAFDVGAFDLFSPSVIELSRGGTVTFTFDGPAKSHTATDGTGLGLYDSGAVAPGGPDLAVTFVAAGRFPVVCSLHAGMDATVEVPISAFPDAATPSERVTLTWASVRAAADLVYDVQLRRPGRAWAMWRDDTRARRGTIEVGRAGTWRFRARLTRPSTGASSTWSRVAQVLVS